MTTTTTAKASTIDAAAQACIGAAARELHLPTVRTEATRLAEIANRERQTHLAYLAEVLAAEVDDRTERRRTRRINDAKFPRLKRLADFNVDAVPSIPPATLGHLAAGHYMDAGEPVVLLGDSGTGKRAICSSASAWPPANRAAASVTSPPHNWSTSSSKPPTNESSQGWSAATAASTCSASTNSATSRSTPAEQNCCSRSSPNAKNEHPSRSPPTCHSASGARYSLTPGSSPPSSTASPSTPTSSRPAPSPTDYAPARQPDNGEVDPRTRANTNSVEREDATITIVDLTALARDINAACRLEGTFVLRSGQTSKEYFDKYLFESQPALLRRVAEAMVPLLPTDTELLGGLELGGVPIATMVSSLTGLPAIFVRKQAKTYGTCRLAEGADVTGKTITLIEDVITTGGAVRDATIALRAEDARATVVVCAIDRSETNDGPLLDVGITTRAVFTRQQLAAS